MKGSKPIDTLMDPNDKLLPGQGEPLSNPKRYRWLVPGDIVTKFVKSNDQLADIFTKSLTGPRINYICNKL
ncbi:hypothetical protein MTR67_051915, partial [Solanum verrucosum]